MASKPKDPRPTGTPDVHLDGETVRHALAATAHQPGSLIRRSLGDKGLHLHGEEGRHPIDTSSRLEGAIEAARSDAHFSNHPDRHKHVDALHRLALANLQWQGHELRQPQRWVGENEHATEPASAMERAARAVVTGKEPRDEDLLADAHRIHRSSGGQGLSDDELKRTLPNMSPFHRVLVSHNIARTLADRLEVAQHKIGGAPPSTLGKAASTPPKGYRPIPHSAHGGYVKGHGAEAEYWYPNRRAATRAALDVVGRLAGHAKRAHQHGLQADLTGKAEHSEAWGASHNLAVDQYRDVLPGHLAEIGRHLKAERAELGRGRGAGRVAPASNLPNRKALADAMVAAHVAEGTAQPLGRTRPNQYAVPYVVGRNSPGSEPLDVARADDAQLLQALAGTAIRHGKHAGAIHDAIYDGVTMAKAATATPPAGYSPIPESASGGYHRRTSKGWVHWYPSKQHARAAFDEHHKKASDMMNMELESYNTAPELAQYLAHEAKRHERLRSLAGKVARAKDYQAPIEVGGHMVTPDSPAHRHLTRADGFFGRARSARVAGHAAYDARSAAQLERDDRDQTQYGYQAVDDARAAEGYHGEVTPEHLEHPDPQHEALLQGRGMVQDIFGKVIEHHRAQGDYDAAARAEVTRAYLTNPTFRQDLGDHSFAATGGIGLKKALGVLLKGKRALGWGPDDKIGRRPGRGAASGAATPQPPAGFEPIPGSRSGGFRQRGAKGYKHWYPSHGSALAGMRERATSVVANATYGHEARQLARRSTAANAAMSHRTADQHEAAIPGLLADVHSHGDEVARHVAETGAPTTSLPGRMGLISSIEEVHEAAGTAQLDGDRVVIPYSDDVNSDAARALDLRSASDAELLTAAAQTAADNPEHAHRLVRPMARVGEEPTGDGERRGYEQDMAARVERLRSPAPRPRMRPQVMQ